MSNSFLDWFMPLVTNQDNWTIPVILFWLWLMIFQGKRGRIAAVLILIAITISDSIAAQIIKPWIGRIRPSHAIIDNINLLVPRGGTYGFVSNHATTTMTAAVIVGYFYEKWKPYALGISLMIGLSRIYVGVHYPADVIGGWLFGFVIAWLVISLWILVKTREIKRGHSWTKYN